MDAYIHMGGQIGVLVELTGQGEEVRALAREVAMHIAAAKPKFLSKDDVPAEKLTEEREIVMTRMAADPKNAGKPAENSGKRSPRAASARSTKRPSCWNSPISANRSRPSGS